MGKRCGLYLRVSTEDQSNDLQRRELLDYAQARGLAIIRIYEDKATGTNDKRAALNDLYQDARSRKIDTIIVWKLDRLFRSLKHLVAVLSEWQDMGIEFISLKDNIDLTTPQGRLLTHLLGAFGEFEASLIRERVRAGIANAKRKGKRLGRRPVVDRERVLNLRRVGKSLREIAIELSTSKSAVSKILKKAALQVAEKTATN
jgi:putative DNA-invertase from lambdoid prophage Rac